MQDLKSLNFEPLRSVYPELANMGGYAEHYAHSDPESALVKLRNFAERMVDRLYIRLKLERLPASNFVDLLHNSSFQTVAQPLVLDKFHLLIVWVTVVLTVKVLMLKMQSAVSKRLGS